MKNNQIIYTVHTTKTLTEHGGDIYTQGIYKGKKLIDYSSNINFLGIPKGFFKTLEEVKEGIMVYPDIQYRQTKDDIIAYHKQPLHHDNLILGNGASEILDLCISQFQKITLVAPSFSEYAISAKKHNVDVVYSMLKEDMTFDYVDILHKLKQTDGLMIANPNNPNGAILNKERFSPILDYCEANNKFIIIDECFVEFTGDKTVSFIEEIQHYQCLIVVRAITKFFALPGLRLGWGVSKNRMFLEHIRSMQMPWNINTFAAASTKYMLFDKVYYQSTIEATNKERTFLVKHLQQIPFINHVYESKSNFLLCRLQGISDQQLFDYCLKNDVLIRMCHNYYGLDHHFIRLAVKNRKNNEKLIQLLQQFKKEDIDGTVK